MVVLEGLIPNQRISDDTGHPFVIVSLASTEGNYSPEDKKRIIEYMKNANVCSAGGYVNDLVKNKETKIEGVGFDDGQYSWDSQDIYHIEEYNGSVSADFLRHVLKQ